jgi:hypothetical protein
MIGKSGYKIDEKVGFLLKKQGLYVWRKAFGKNISFV